MALGDAFLMKPFKNLFKQSYSLLGVMAAIFLYLGHFVLFNGFLLYTYFLLLNRNVLQERNCYEFLYPSDHEDDPIVLSIHSYLLLCFLDYLMLEF